MNESNAVTSTPRLVSQLLFGDEQNWHRVVVLLYKTNLSSSSFSFSPPVLCCVLRAVLLLCTVQIGNLYFNNSTFNTMWQCCAKNVLPPNGSLSYKNYKYKYQHCTHTLVLYGSVLLRNDDV